MGFPSSFIVSGVPNSDSINGLKFGHKIYFEDVGIAAPVKSGGGSSSSAGSGAGDPPSPAKKVKGGVLPGGQPSRCQVVGCEVDLSDAKAYYSRHKVCGMHSKSPKVVVAGLEQRFCQQCSRFHLLPEFDQGKRSCRRRLAGHNERRRKPPPGSLFPSRYGRYSPSIFENCSSGGVLMNFSAYARSSEREPWQTMSSSEWASGSQTTSIEKYLGYSWESSSDNAPSDSSFTIQGSSAGIGCQGAKFPPGQCYTGVSNSTDCALSLLSNQPWASRNQTSTLQVNNLISDVGTHVVQPAAPEAVAANHFLNASSYVTRCSNEMPHNWRVGHITQPSGELTGAFELPQQSGKSYMALEQCRLYDSTHQIQWSL